MNDAAHDQSPEEQVSANETDGAIEANPFSAPEAPVAAVMPPLIEGFDPIELSALKTCKTGFNLLFYSFLLLILALLIPLLLVIAGATPQDLGVVILAPIGCAIIGVPLFVIGNGMLITAPARSNAKKLYQVSFVCLLAAILLPIVVSYTLTSSVFETVAEREIGEELEGFDKVFSSFEMTDVEEDMEGGADFDMLSEGMVEASDDDLVAGTPLEDTEENYEQPPDWMDASDDNVEFGSNFDSDSMGAGGLYGRFLGIVNQFLGMVLLIDALLLLQFVTWCLGVNRLMTFVNEPVNGARALSLLKLSIVQIGLFIFLEFVRVSPAVVAVIVLVVLVLSIILLVRTIVTCKGGRDTIARILG
ncbi:MAG: hypothetical protein CMM04_14215 [Rhodopirellula sp.]|nr:hypothetical protein [Rhodopirellula sp.]